MRRAFVFGVCGDRHVRTVNTALRFLKAFSRRDIVVVTGQTTLRPDHDQCVAVPLPDGFDDHQASILLKTGLHRIVGDGQTEFCYLDSDVLAVSREIDDVFKRRAGPVTFAQDHCDIAEFSRAAVYCPCTAGPCHHLQDEARRLFGARLPDAGWRHWNGGVFLFDEDSRDFLDTWHEYCLLSFEDPAWKVRDQGTLAATIWTMGLQDQDTLPPAYNSIVDPFKGLSVRQREGLPAQNCVSDNAYSLTGEPGKDRPFALHLINGGANKPGWKNFDDAAALLRSTELWREARRVQAGYADSGPGDAGAERGAEEYPPLVPVSRPVRARRLTKDNRIVHGLWIGKSLSKLELLTLRSFTACGHEFHLWRYDDLATPVPPGVMLHDAGEVLPANAIFRRRSADRESGVGPGSYGAFSDLFRYKLLWEKGGYWADMDMTCLRPLDFRDKYVLRPHRVGVVGNLMKCPPGSDLMRETYAQARATVDGESPWLLTNRLLSATVRRLDLGKYIRPELSAPDAWHFVAPLVLGAVLLPKDLYVIHWLNEAWKARPPGEAPDRDGPPAGSALARLYELHGLSPDAH